MSARRHRPHRWERPSTRPATRSLASRARRERYTKGQMDEAIDTSMKVGEMMGRKWGERDLYVTLAEMCDDPIALAAWVGGQALAQEVDDYLIDQLIRDRIDSDTQRRIDDAVELGGEEGKDALVAIAREVGLMPPDNPDRVELDPLDVDDLLDEVDDWLRDQSE